MNNKKNILIGAFLILFIILILTIIIKQNINIKSLQKTNSEQLVQIENLKKYLKDNNNINDDLKKEIEKLKKSNQRLEEEIKIKTDEYNRINALYKKEVEPVIFNQDNLLITSNSTINKLKIILNNTGLEGLENAYLKAEETYGVNAIFLVALTAEESSWGNSNRAKTQNNLSGFGVYTDNSFGVTFDSKEDNIMQTARLLKQDYLISTGKYYNGTSSSDVNIKYCPDDNFNWSKNINRIAYELVDKINSHN